VEAAEDRIPDVGVLHHAAGAAERLLVPVAHPVRLAVFRLQRIRGPQDRDLPRPAPQHAGPAVPDEEPVRLAIVRLDGGGDEADETAAFDDDVVYGHRPREKGPPSRLRVYKKVTSRLDGRRLALAETVRMSLQ